MFIQDVYLTDVLNVRLLYNYKIYLDMCEEREVDGRSTHSSRIWRSTCRRRQKPSSSVRRASHPKRGEIHRCRLPGGPVARLLPPSPPITYYMAPMSLVTLVIPFPLSPSLLRSVILGDLTHEAPTDLSMS